MTPVDDHLYVCNYLADWEYGYTVAGINNPEFQITPRRYRVRTVAVRPDAVTT